MAGETQKKTLAQILRKYVPDDRTAAVLESAGEPGLRADNENRILEITVPFPALVRKADIYALEDGIRDAYALSAVKILPKYDPSLFTADYMPEILAEAGRVGVVVNGFFNDCTWIVDGDSIEISVPYGDGGVSLINGADTGTVISNIIYSEFSKRFRVTIRCSDDHMEAALRRREEFEKHERELASGLYEEITAARAAQSARKEAAEQSAETPKDTAPKSASLNSEAPSVSLEDKQITIGCRRFDLSAPEIIYGSGFEIGNITPIRDLRDRMRCTVVGEVFETAAKDIRQGLKTAYTIGIYDGDSSVYMKFTIDNDGNQKDRELKEFADSLSKGDAIVLTCSASRDRFDGETVIRPSGAAKVSIVRRKDTAEKKRVELHLHTTMSAMDAVISPKELLKTVKRWGMPAVAITDHGNVQAFPEAMIESAELGVKVIYGMEAYFVDDTARAVYGESSEPIDGEFVVFDIETTGLSPLNCRITEIGAVLVSGGEIKDRFSTFVDPECPIPEEITKLTSITDEMVAGAPKSAEAVRSFLEFAGGRLLVAHNANFDISFIRYAAERCGLQFSNPYLDTVALSRYLNRDLSKHKLDNLAEYYGLGDFDHHRAHEDAEMLALIFMQMTKKLWDEGVRNVSQISGVMGENSDPLKLPTYHQIILVKDRAGLKNLYKLVSMSYLDYYRKVPRIPKSALESHRDGLIIGSACEAGELFRAIVENRPEADLLEIASFYDYLEIQPLSNNSFMIREGTVSDAEQLKALNRRVIEIGEKAGKPVVATCDAHFMEKEDEILRKILLAGMKFKDADSDLGLYFRTTDEMLEEFSYLGAEKAYEVVVENTNLIADMIETVLPIPEGKYTPSIEGADEDLERECYRHAEEIYGDPLPEIVKSRLDKELTSIITNGFAVLYMIARKLVKYSEEQGYLVGSRGSVGSSFVAFAAGISEVNPLPPHYVCRKCRYSDFSNEGGYGSGFDFPDRDCPVCGERLYSDGHDIPFETFLGFKGDKSPDIDLNFSGEVQAKVHKYTAELFGKENVFRAGTLGTLADKTAFGFVSRYVEDRGMNVCKAEISRLTSRCVGVKRTTGQHPGGIIVIPKDHDIYEFTPIQHPADDTSSETITTHFAFSYLHETILKLDELGHDVPTKYKALERFSGTSVLDVKMNDPDVYRLFTGTEPLGIKSTELIDSETGTLGIPELGTSFVKPVLIHSKPKDFADLIQVSGLTHGEGVWLGNAKDLIDNNICDLSKVIGTRDGIMLDLIKFGLDKSMSFKIMEMVRKNKKGKPIPDEMMEAMREKNVPDWYIDSLQKIRYMFPKAHAAAYIMSAIRIAWYKVHMPLAFYAGFFTAAPGEFDAEIVMGGRRAVRNKLEEIKSKGMEASQKENAMFATLQLVEEALARGIRFLPIDLYKSDAFDFLPEDGAIRMPFSSLGGIGENAARSLVAARDSGEIFSKEELRLKSKVTKSVMEILEKNGVLDGLSDTDQISMF